MKIGHVGLLLLGLGCAAPYALGEGPPTVGQLKKLYLTCPIVLEGKPAAMIVIPNDEHYVHVAEGINARVKRLSGVTLPVKKDIEVMRLSVRGFETVPVFRVLQPVDLSREAIE